MFIQTEQTPNPSSLKFLPGQQVMATGTADFPNREAAANAPLAERLFAIDGVVGVFLGSDFVTISKRDDTEWYLLKPTILGALMEHFASGQPAVLGESGSPAEEPGDQDEVVQQIRELLDTRVRPAVAQDGGDITFEGFDNGVVFLRMQGACSGCPSSTMTLKAGVENLLRHYVPEVVEVRAVM